jgi:hypothetical protein
MYVLFFISLATRRIEYIACTSNPHGRWTAQQTRNLVMQLGDKHSFRFLIDDRDSKFSHAFGAAFRAEGVSVIRTPIQAPNANAYAERWVRTVRFDCLDQFSSSAEHPDPLGGHAAAQNPLTVACFENRQRFAGTRRVHQTEHKRERAGMADTQRSADLEDKRARRCPRVDASTAPKPPW